MTPLRQVCIKNYQKKKVACSGTFYIAAPIGANSAVASGVKGGDDSKGLVILFLSNREEMNGISA